MMTKDEIKAMIAETIQTNNKKAITAQSLANVLTTMAENSGEGGGLKFSEERTIYGLEEMTEEQKAYNAETYRKMMDEEAVTINVGGIILTPYYFVEDECVVFDVSSDIDGIERHVLIKLRSDGSVEVSYTVGADDSLLIEYGNAESAKAVFADPQFSYKRITLFSGIAFVDVSLKSLPITENGKRMCFLTYQIGGCDVCLVYDVDTGEILDEETDYDTLTVYIDVSDADSCYALANKEAVSGKYGYNNLCVVKQGYSSVKYNALQIESKSNYIQVIIYRNNTFETWQINADGTSTLVTA